MTEADRELSDRLLRAERESLLANPLAAPRPGERPAIHFSELPEPAPGSPLTTEWNFYRREVGRLLAEGHEGHWVLIKGAEIVGIWEAEEDANRVRIERFSTQPVLMHCVRTHEPVLRGGGYDRRWH